VAPTPAEPEPDSTLAPPSATPIGVRRQVRWGQLAAVAAVVVLLAGVVAIPLLNNGGASKTLSTPNEPAAAPSPIPLIDRGNDYSTQELDRLAAAIASSRAATEGAGRGATTAPLTSLPPVPTGPALAADSTISRTALDCVTSGAGLQPQDRAVPVYLEEADVEGTPAYVGAFQLPDVKLRLLLIAVTRDGCQPLYNVRQTI
jgi:hypothetical protein